MSDRAFVCGSSSYSAQEMSTACLYSQTASTIGSWGLATPRPNKKNGKSVYIYSSSTSNTSPKIQLVGDGEPSLIVQKETADGYELALANSELAAFLHMLDEFTVNVAETKCMEWFAKKLKDTDLTRMHVPLLNKNDDGCFVKVRKGSNINVWKARIGKDGGMTYSNGQLSDLQSGKKIWPCVTVSGIYFLPRSFGMVLTLTDVLCFAEEIPTFVFNTEMKLRYEDDTEDISPEELEPST